MKDRRLSIAIFACALALPLVTGMAFAQTEPPSWLLKYISFYANVGSNPPNIAERTIIRLYGWFPYDYGHVGPVYVDDPGHVRLTLRPNATIALDTTRTWAADFNLGFLPLGDHQLTVTRTFVNEAGTDSITESASFSFPVIDLGDPGPPPPPPGPPPPPNALVLYVTGWFTVPHQPTALEATTLVVRGVFPYDCGEIVDVVSDSSSVSFTMQPGPACSDTTRTWSQPFSLGQLHEGLHVIHVTRRFVSPDSNVVAEGDVGFYVWKDYNTPPPPPPAGPPEFPSLLIRCLSNWYTTTPPTTHAPTTLVLWGWFPYYCGQIVGAGVPAPQQVFLTLRNNPNGCADTTLTWFQSFDLGLLPAGAQEIGITLNVEGDSATEVPATRQATITLYVDDRDVSVSVPNPFVSDTRFVVNSPRAEDVDVGIYDLHGRRVTTLFKGPMAPGSREFRWDGRREDGSRAAIGIYFSRVAFSNRVVTRKLVMLPR